MVFFVKFVGYEVGKIVRGMNCGCEVYDIYGIGEIVV